MCDPFQKGEDDDDNSIKLPYCTIPYDEFDFYIDSDEEARNPYKDLSDEDAVKKAVAEYRMLYNESRRRFPDDDAYANLFTDSARDLACEARKRYGDSPKASEWLAEELDWLQAKLEKRRNAGDAKKTP